MSDRCQIHGNRACKTCEVAVSLDGSLLERLAAIKAENERNAETVPTDDVEALAQALYAKDKTPDESGWLWEDHSEKVHDIWRGYARRFLASDWLRAHDARVRRDATREAWERAHDVFCRMAGACSMHLRPGDRHLLDRADTAPEPAARAVPTEGAACGCRHDVADEMFCLRCVTVASQVAVEMRHDPTYSSSSFGRWVSCSCGWRWGYTGTAAAAQLAFGEHLADSKTPAGGRAPVDVVRVVDGSEPEVPAVPPAGPAPTPPTVGEDEARAALSRLPHEPSCALRDFKAPGRPCNCAVATLDRLTASCTPSSSVEALVVEVGALLDQYNQLDDDDPAGWECAPEDRWRFGRDLRAALARAAEVGR